VNEIEQQEQYINTIFY